MEKMVPTCAMDGTAIVRAGTLYASVFGMTSRWGNALSNYWQARGMALLGCYDFLNPSAMADWMAYLPKHAEKPPLPQPEAWEEACASCSAHQDDWLYPHRCVGSMPWIAPTISIDTRSALSEAARAFNTQLPAFGPKDAVIYDRCASDTVLAHGEYGPLSFSAYETLPLDVETIFVVGDQEYQRTQPICVALNASIYKRLTMLRPSAEVVYSASSAFEDYAKLVFAPFLIRPPSSFSLWAALANNGTVVSPPLFRGAKFSLPNWIWIDSPVLYPEMVTFNQSSIDQVVEWLETH